MQVIGQLQNIQLRCSILDFTLQLILDHLDFEFEVFQKFHNIILVAFQPKYFNILAIFKKTTVAPNVNAILQVNISSTVQPPVITLD